MRTLTAFVIVAVLLCWAHELAAQGDGGGFGGGGFGGGEGGFGGGGGFGGRPVPPRKPSLRPTFTATVLRLRVPAAMVKGYFAEGKLTLSHEDVAELLAAGEVLQIVRAATPDGGISWERTTSYISGFSSIVAEYAVGWQPETSEYESGSALGLVQPPPLKKGRPPGLMEMLFEQKSVAALEERAVPLPVLHTRLYRTDLVANTEDGPAAVNKIEARPPEPASERPELKLALPHQTEYSAEYVGPVSGGQVVIRQTRRIDSEHDEIVLTWSESSGPLEGLAKPDASDASFSRAVEAEVLLAPLADFLTSQALSSSRIDAAAAASLREKGKTLWRGGGVVSLFPGRESLHLDRETNETFVAGFTTIVAEGAVAWEPQTTEVARKSSLRVRLLGRTKADEAILRVLSFALTEGVVARTVDVPLPSGRASVEIGLPEETEWEVENVIVALPRERTLVLVFGVPPVAPGETPPAEQVALFLLTAR